MATRPQGFGMTAEIDAKMAAKYDLGMEKEVQDWIEALCPEAPRGDQVFAEWLKSGVVLCGVINALQPGIVKKVNESKMAFKQMENIGNFLNACEQYGVKKFDLFQTSALYEATNMLQVLTGMMALGRRAQSNGFKGPVIGVQESSENKRAFTEEQLKQGQTIIGQQAGNNLGANQSGLNFGQSRQILKE